MKSDKYFTAKIKSFKLFIDEYIEEILPKPANQYTDMNELFKDLDLDFYTLFFVSNKPFDDPAKDFDRVGPFELTDKSTFSVNDEYIEFKNLKTYINNDYYKKLVITMRDGNCVTIVSLPDYDSITGVLSP